MCPEEEIEERKLYNAVSEFERLEGDEVVGIKGYQRSSADKKMNEPNKVRPPQILLKTVEYIRDCIVDLDRLED